MDYQPFGFDILPLYIVLLWIAPTLLYIGLRSKPLMMLTSLLLYLSVVWQPNITVLTAQNRPWTFQPLGWQLVFCFGILSYLICPTKVLEKRPKIWIAASFFAVILISVLGIQLNATGALGSQVWTGKMIPGLLRQMHFLALALFFASVYKPMGNWLNKSDFAKSLATVGSNALPVFLWGLFITHVSVIICQGQSVYDVLLMDAFGIISTVTVANVLRLQRNRRPQQKSSSTNNN